MNKIYAVILVAVGAGLIYLGIDGTSSVGTSWHGFPTHSASDVPIWLLLAGVLVGTAGLFWAWWDRSRFD